MPTTRPDPLIKAHAASLTATALQYFDFVIDSATGRADRHRPGSRGRDPWPARERQLPATTAHPA